MKAKCLWDDMEMTLRRRLTHLKKVSQAYQRLNSQIEASFVDGEIQMIENILAEYFDL